VEGRGSRPAGPVVRGARHQDVRVRPDRAAEVVVGLPHRDPFPRPVRRHLRTAVGPGVGGGIRVEDHRRGPAGSVIRGARHQDVPVRPDRAAEVLGGLPYRDPVPRPVRRHLSVIVVPGVGGGIRVEGQRCHPAGSVVRGARHHYVKVRPERTAEGVAGAPHRDPVPSPVRCHLSIIIAPGVGWGIRMEGRRRRPSGSTIGGARHQDVVVRPDRAAEGVTGLPHRDPVSRPVRRHPNNPVVPGVAGGIRVEGRGCRPAGSIVRRARHQDVHVRPDRAAEGVVGAPRRDPVPRPVCRYLSSSVVSGVAGRIRVEGRGRPERLGLYVRRGSDQKDQGQCRNLSGKRTRSPHGRRSLSSQDASIRHDPLLRPDDDRSGSRSAHAEQPASPSLHTGPCLQAARTWGLREILLPRACERQEKSDLAIVNDGKRQKQPLKPELEDS
jgi:hypothetical protein